MKVVIYNGERYEVFYSYTSGYYELKKLEAALDEIILVHCSEVIQLDSSA